MGKSIMDNQETLAQHWVHKTLDEDKQNATQRHTENQKDEQHGSIKNMGVIPGAREG